MTTSAIPAAATASKLESLAKQYRAARDKVSERVHALNSEVRAVQARRVPGIKSAVAEAADAQAKLVAAIQDAPHLFVKPRTMTLAGIRIGFQKGKGRTLWPKAEALLAAIKRNFSPASAKLLIATKEEPNKEAILTLPAPELKKLGVEIEGAGDEVFVKAADTEVDKMVAAILKEGAVEEAAGS